MSQSNLDIVKGVYAAFSVGDIPAVLGVMSPGIVWNEAENNLPLAEGNPYVGPQAVLEGVFMRLGEGHVDLLPQVNDPLEPGGLEGEPGRPLPVAVGHVELLQGGLRGCELVGRLL